MISHQLNREDGILTISPEGRLEASDFEELRSEVDPFLEEAGSLNGLVIHARSFPGWDDFAALISHLKFVRDHHRKIGKVAAVSDSKVLSIMPRIVDHFVHAEVKHFPYEDKDKALQWLRSGDE